MDESVPEEGEQACQATVVCGAQGWHVSGDRGPLALLSQLFVEYCLAKHVGLNSDKVVHGETEAVRQTV